MGTHWACPCGERDLTVRKLKIRAPIYQFSEPASIRQSPVSDQIRPREFETPGKVHAVTMVVSVRRYQLGRFLGGQIGNDKVGERVEREDLVPYSIISHPASSEEAVVLFRSRNSVEPDYPAHNSTNYRVFSFRLTGNNLSQWRKQLEEDLNKFYKNSSMIFIGAIHDYVGDYDFAMLMDSSSKKQTREYYVDEIQGVMNNEILQDTLNEHNQNRGSVFKGLISKNSSVWFLIFEKQPKDIKKAYIVLDFPRNEIAGGDDFPDELASRVEQCTEGTNIEYCGLGSNPKTQQLFLIFSVN